MNPLTRAATAKRIFSLLLCLLLLATAVVPRGLAVQGWGKVIRVGWYDSIFNNIDSVGRRSGYAYEYQIKIAAYTGWRYEYVTGSWSELLEMLKAGEIDLMSDVSYTQERAESILYPNFPMGAEEYYLFIAADNRDISSSDLTTLNGKRIGANEGSIQEALLREWVEEHGLDAEVVPVNCPESTSLAMLYERELDGYVTVDSFTTPQLAIPVTKIGSSDFFFAVSKARPDLLTELNDALSRVQDEDRFYNLQLFEKYFRNTGANAFLSGREVDWLEAHGPIRIGYQDNYLAFCAQDKETGALTGALKDFLAYASDSIANAHLDFEATAFPSIGEALAAMHRGKIDCVFPANFGPYDGETMDIILTPPLMETDLYAVVRASDQQVFLQKDHVNVAVNEGDLNYATILQDHFPNWKKVYFPDLEERLEAVSNGIADCVLISNYRYNNIARLCEKYHLIPLSTGQEVDYRFAVNTGETELYTILGKITSLVSTSMVNAALSYYITEDAKVTLTDLITDHLGLVSAVVLTVLVIILGLLIRTMRVERKAQELIAATELDDLTGLYTRKYFFQYANRLFTEHPGVPMDAIVVDIEQFHTVNALNGRDYGDQVLRALGNEIRAVAEEHKGIAGRFEADCFDIYCHHTDDYAVLYNRLQAKLDALEVSAHLRLRMGVMPWREKLTPELLFDEARTACGMARGHYKEHLVVFDEKVQQRELYEQRLLRDLRRALDEFQFEVYYQPKFDIQASPPRLVSAEALVRWRHPDLGLIPPVDFIPLFERNGLIGNVDKYVWNEAAKQVSRWREQYGVNVPVSVNLSRVDVFDPNLENALDEIIAYNRLDYNDFKLEVTESAYTENAGQVIQVVENLRKKGFQVEMDDFGTGYSSLNMLSAMPVDVLKMDRGFIQNIDHDEKDIQLVALILDIARNLKIPVVAEGVETEEQIQLLKKLGCKLVQGYYFSRPLHAADFEKAFLQNQSVSWGG